MLSPRAGCDESSVSYSSAPPTTSIWSSSFSSLSDDEPGYWLRCCDKYSVLSASTSTVMPFALSFLACLSIAFAIFFFFLALFYFFKGKQHWLLIIFVMCNQPKLYSLLSGSNFFRWYRLTGASLWMSVVRWTTRSFFRMLTFPHFCTPVLKPYLRWMGRRERGYELIIDSFCSVEFTAQFAVQCWVFVFFFHWRSHKVIHISNSRRLI